MCTEKDLIECHRTILVTNLFYKIEFSIIHIMSDNSIQTQQQDINNRLLDMYFPDRCSNLACLQVEIYQRKISRISI